MKPNQRGRFNNRHNGSARPSRPQTIFRNTALESSGPCGKLRGTALQLHEKYLAAAKDALIQNDDILAETCFQYADHYLHIQNQAIANEQAFHAQQQAQRSPVLDTSPEPEEEAPVEEESLSDGDLKVTDLSVPVESMNRAAQADTTEKPRRRLRLRQPTDNPTPTDSDEISG